MKLFEDKYLNGGMGRKIAKQWINFKNLAIHYGQFKTIEKWDCVDQKGNPIPWYTYPAIEYLSTLDFSNKIIFEYGAGNSSLFWASRAKKVISVEHDEAWHSNINKKKAHNQDVFLFSDRDKYINSVDNITDNIDIYIIDGIHRKECVLKVLENVNSLANYMIILDNSDWYQHSCERLRKSDLIEIDFHGFTPINDYTSTTSLFLSRDILLHPKVNHQPGYSKCAIKLSSIYDSP
jgi:hypothetical protein